MSNSTKRICFLFVAVLININFLFSQIAPVYKDTLNLNQVSGLMYNNSDYGWNLSSGTPGYFIPKGSNTSPLFAGSMWIGGYNAGTLHAAAMTYRQNGMDFWPGPLDTVTATADTTTASPLKKIWKIKRSDIDAFTCNWHAGRVQNGTFLPSNSILTWPANTSGSYSRQMAPYVDVNNNGIYDPLNDGDYPLMRGDEMLWWVFNDKANTHTETGGSALGVEVHASAYAFACPVAADSNRVLNYTTFYHYDIYNRSASRYDTSFVGLWFDPDLGNGGDDYVGCDIMNNYGFVYNGDNLDEGTTGYQSNLPVFACNVLNGPVASPGDLIDNNNNGYIDESNESCLMNSFLYYTNNANAQTGNPAGAQQYYNFMHAKWRDGTPITYGAAGTSVNPSTKFIYPGLSDPYGISLGGSISSPVSPPVSNWTQYTAGIAKGDARFIIGVGPFTMQPGQKYEVDYALVFSQDSVNCYGGVDTCVLARAKQDNIRVKNWFNSNNFPSCLMSNLNLDTLSGTVTDSSNNPVTSGKVYVFRRKISHVGFQDTLAGYAPIAPNGKYFFTCLDTGRYIIKAVADTNLYPTSVSTYYNSSVPGVYRWDSAQMVVLTTLGVNVGGKDIKIIQLPAAPASARVIKGKVTQGVGYGQRYHGGYPVMGAPLKGVDIKLGKAPGGSPAARTTTDANGNYTFSNLQLGTYNIYVDVPNYPMDSIRAVVLSTTDTICDNNNYYIDSVKVWVLPYTPNVRQSLWAPNAFTPDGNNNNEIFYIHGDIQSFEMRVFNRLGEEVFYSNDIKVGWDGKRQGGKEMPAGAYLYNVRGTVNGSAINIKDFVNLIR